MPRLIVPEEIAALSRALHPRLKKKLRSSLQRILTDAHGGKELIEELAGLRSFKVGRFRIITR